MNAYTYNNDTEEGDEGRACFPHDHDYRTFGLLAFSMSRSLPVGAADVEILAQNAVVVANFRAQNGTDPGGLEMRITGTVHVVPPPPKKWAWR